jgi:hypothetical protein
MTCFGSRASTLDQEVQSFEDVMLPNLTVTETNPVVRQARAVSDQCIFSNASVRLDDDQSVRRDLTRLSA